jgi:hypothetical protein
MDEQKLTDLAVDTALKLASKIADQHPHGYMASASDAVGAAATILAALIMATAAGAEQL